MDSLDKALSSLDHRLCLIYGLVCYDHDRITKGIERISQYQRNKDKKRLKWKRETHTNIFIKIFFYCRNGGIITLENYGLF